MPKAVITVLMVAAMALMTAAGCGPTTADDLPASEESQPAAPTARRATLACNFDFADHLDLATGTVTRLRASEPRTGDLTCVVSRRLGLDANGADGTCVVDALIDDPPRFDDVSAVETSCQLDGVWCGILGTPYESICAGRGGVVSDRQGQRYAVLVVNDATRDPDLWTGEFVVEYAPLDAPLDAR
jgi:hypothetical protein